MDQMSLKDILEKFIKQKQQIYLHCRMQLNQIVLSFHIMDNSTLIQFAVTLYRQMTH